MDHIRTGLLRIVLKHVTYAPNLNLLLPKLPNLLPPNLQNNAMTQLECLNTATIMQNTEAATENTQTGSPLIAQIHATNAAMTSMECLNIAIIMQNTEAATENTSSGSRLIAQIHAKNALEFRSVFFSVNSQTLICVHPVARLLSQV